MVEVTTDEQQASSQCFPLLLWLHFIWLSFFLSCCMEKTKVERDFPQHLSSQHQSSRQCHLRDLPKKSQCKMLSFTSKAHRSRCSFSSSSVLPLFSYCVLEKLIQIAFSSFFLYNVRTFQTSKGTKGGCILCLQQCTNSYLLLHRTHYGRLDTMKKFLDYCLLHFQTLDGVSTKRSSLD